MKSKVIACIVARTVSTRLPLKVLRDLEPNVSLLDYLINRVKSVNSIDSIYICTSKNPVDDILEDVAKRNNINIYRGSEEQVIERLIGAAKIEKADYVVRITGDNPLTSTEFIDDQIKVMQEDGLGYTRLSNVPLGATAEVIRYSTLEQCNEIMDPDVSEYMMLYLFEPDTFNCGILIPFENDYSMYSLTVDTQEDFIRVKKVIQSIGDGSSFITLRESVNFLEETEKITSGNVDEDTMVKLPYGKKIKYKEFNQDMERRKRYSKNYQLYE